MNRNGQHTAIYVDRLESARQGWDDEWGGKFTSPTNRRGRFAGRCPRELAREIARVATVQCLRLYVRALSESRKCRQCTTSAKEIGRWNSVAPACNGSLLRGEGGEGVWSRRRRKKGMLRAEQTKVARGLGSWRGCLK